MKNKDFKDMDLYEKRSYIKTLKEYHIWDTISLSIIKGKLAWNDNHSYGGIIEDGNDHQVTISGNVYHTCTGDCLYDSLTINGFKVYDI